MVRCSRGVRWIAGAAIVCALVAPMQVDAVEHPLTAELGPVAWFSPRSSPPTVTELARDDVSPDNPIGSRVTVDHLANDDASLLGETFSLVHPVHGSDAIDMRIEGEGWWWAMMDGQGAYWIEFEPDAALVGDPTPQRYSIRDAEGNIHNALVTITFSSQSTTTIGGAVPTNSHAAARSGPTTLPRTGSNQVALSVVALVTALAGVAMLSIQRRSNG